MNISKGSLISEFSLKSFYVGMDLCNDYITQQLYSIKHKKELKKAENQSEDEKYTLDELGLIEPKKKKITL